MSLLELPMSTIVNRNQSLKPKNLMKITGNVSMHPVNIKTNAIEGLERIKEV